MSDRPCRGFIASSSIQSAKDLAQEIADVLLERFTNANIKCEINPWFGDDDLKNGMLLTALINKAENVDFAVVLLHPDDPGARGDQPEIEKIYTRDSVIFEMGLFIAKRGIPRVFVFRPDASTPNFSAPTDIQGLITYNYNVENWKNHVTLHCSAIVKKLKSDIDNPPKKDLSVLSDKPTVSSIYVICGISAHMELLDHWANPDTAKFNFMGTMVGFSYVIPPQLSKHVVENPRSDYEVRVYGSRYSLESSSVSESNLFIFPYAFVLKTIKNIMEEYEKKKLKQKSIHIVFYVYYYPHDMIDAIFSVTEKHWFQSQGLSPRQIGIYLDERGEDRYVGIKLPIDEELIARYRQAIARRKEASGKYFQRWELELGRDGSKKLDLVGCVFLEYKDGELIVRYPPMEEVPARSYSGEDVNEFAETRYRALTELVPSIGETDDKIRKAFASDLK